MIEVFSSGGGTQSSAIAALIVQGKLPKPDFVLIADTGREMPSTWEYLDTVTAPALKGVGIEVHRIKASEWVNNWGRGVFATNGDLIIPAFTNINGSGKLSAFCSKAWKVEVVNRWLSKMHGITRSKFRKWIGFSVDEPKRWKNMKKGKEFESGLIRLPLVDDLPTMREESIQIVEQMGWPTPPRSRCFDCPNQTDFEWLEVSRDPALWAASVARDEFIRTRDEHAFVHSSLRPLSEVDLSAADDVFSGSCPSGECFL
jgi:hypothetical protein